MKPAGGAQKGGPPSRQKIAALLAAGKAKPTEGKSSQQDIQAKVPSSLYTFCLLSQSTLLALMNIVQQEPGSVCQFSIVSAVTQYNGRFLHEHIRSDECISSDVGVI